MSFSTVTCSLDIQADPDTVFRYVRDARNLPDWATPFAESVERDASGTLLATSNGETFPFRIVDNGDSRTVDYLRQLAPQREGGAYLRVLPHPSRGAVVIMTVPVAEAADPSDVSEVVTGELTALARRIGTSS